MYKTATQIFQVLLILNIFSTLVGCISYEGHSFVLAFNPYNTTMTGQLYIMNAGPPTTCTVTTDNNTTVVTVKGNDQTTFDLLTNNMIQSGTYVDKRGIRVDCKDQVQLYSITSSVDGDGSVANPVIPIHALSNQYVILFSSGSFVTVLAVSDHTLVSVNVFNCSVTYKGISYTNRDTISLDMDSFDVFQAECENGGNTIHVSSNNKISAYFGTLTLIVGTYYPPAFLEKNSYIFPPVPVPEIGFLRLKSAAHVSKGDYTDIVLYNNVLERTESVMNMFKLTVIGDPRFGPAGIITRVPPVSEYWHDYWIPNIQSHNVTYTRYITVVTESKCISKFGFLGNVTWTDVTVDFQKYSVTSLPAPTGLNRISTTPDCKFAVEVHGIHSERDVYGFFATPVFLGQRHQVPTATAMISPSSSAATPSSDDLKASFNLTCETDGWYIQLKPKTFLSKFRNSHLSNIYLSNAFCSGISQGDVIAFNYSYKDCNTHAQENSTSKTYSNYLVEYGQDPITNLSIRVLWRYDVQCIRPRHEVDSIAFVPVDNTTGIHVQSTSKIKDHQAVIEFYTDNSFSSPLSGNPLKVTTGSRVYVQVETKVTDDVKLFVDNCYVSPAKVGYNSTATVPLIFNRCEDNHSVHIIGTVDKLTRFYFNVFEIPHHHDNIYVTCDVSFCDLMDFTQECQQGCQRSNH